jgi:hypothetical protein
VFWFRWYVGGMPNGKPCRRPNGWRGEQGTRVDYCDGSRITARARARTTMRMVPVIAVTRCPGGVVGCVVGPRSVRDGGRRGPGHVGDAIVHGARVQCRRLLLNHEGPGREDRGKRATTRGPQHCEEYYWRLARPGPAVCSSNPTNRSPHGQPVLIGPDLAHGKSRAGWRSPASYNELIGIGRPSTSTRTAPPVFVEYCSCDGVVSWFVAFRPRRRVRSMRFIRHHLGSGLAERTPSPEAA